MGNNKTINGTSPEGPNCFHIDVRSNVKVEDMEWAGVLFLLNRTLQQNGLSHIEAHLEDTNNG